MGFRSDLAARLRALLRRSREDAELEEEIALHIEMETEKNLAAGLSPAEARRRALIRFGGVERHKEAVRDARGTRWLEDLRADLRYAARMLSRSPGFTGAAALTIALGVGATTAIFSFVNAILLRPLPVHEPARLVSVEELRASGRPRYSASYPYFLEYRDAGRGAVRLGAHGLGELALQAGDGARVVLGSYVSGDYFDLLGIAPARGRFFTTADEVPRVPVPAAVISYRLWQQDFGGDPGVVGATIRLNSRALTVIGVAAPAFQGLVTGLALDVWVPIPMRALLHPHSDIYTPGRQSWLMMFGRLEPGVGPAAVEAALGGVARRIAERDGREPGAAGVQVSRLDGLVGELRTAAPLFLALLLVTAGLVLLIACVNVAGMLLARAATRGREVGIRLALGAGRRRLIRQLLTESTLLFLLGGAGGIVLAIGLARALASFPVPLPAEVSLDVSPDLRVLAFGLLATLGTGLLAGLAPALRASRPGIMPALREGGAVPGAGSARLRSGFVVGQIAVCVLLLVSAGLLVRSLRAALAVDPGMDAANVVVASVDLEPHGYDEARGRLFYERLTEALRARPGVQAVALAHIIPLTLEQIVYDVRVPGHEPPQGAAGFTVDFNIVGPDYFRTVGIPLEGRGFTAADRSNAPGVVIVNRTMARRFWPDGSALGQRIRVGDQFLEIVGVAGDGKYRSLGEDPIPYIYAPFTQRYAPRMVLHVRAPGGPGAVSAMMRDELRALDANVPLAAPAALRDRIRITLVPQQIGAALIGGFGAAGLLLAAVGLYGVLAYAVGRRTREIGVRIALGARPRDIGRLVLRHGSTLLAAGLGIGLLMSLAATPLLRGLLVSVTPADPVALVLAALLLAAAALLASWLPARRAARVDPLDALRAD